MNKVVIIGILVVLAGSFLLFQHFRTRERNSKVNSDPELTTKIHDKFSQLISTQNPLLYRKIDGKFMTIKTAGGKIQPYFFGQDLTDQEFDTVMSFFTKAYQDLVK